MPGRPTERTYYSPLIEIFKEVGFEGVEEISLPGKTFPDIKLTYKGSSFYVQVKIGDLNKVKDILDDISKFFARKMTYESIKDAAGFIGIKFEERLRHIRPDPEKLKIALENSKVFIIISGALGDKPIIFSINGGVKFSQAKLELIQRLREFIEKKKEMVDTNTVVRILKECIDDLAFILREYYLKSPELLVNLVGDIETFKSLLGERESTNIGELLKDENFRAAIVDLAAFILVNQILFYYIYSKKSKGKLPPLDRVNSLIKLKRYFDRILEIDFRPIYDINIVGRLPSEDERILGAINKIIDALNSSPIWMIPQDLLGRVYHVLLPFRTRKVFATFYTHPIAAEILAGLTIDSWMETVIDPACGSGTLLVAAYHAKQERFEEEQGFMTVGDKMRLHKMFVEDQISGVDIMPFAAHIAAMNLCLQNLDVETNNIRITVRDSLDIFEALMESEKEYIVMETISSELAKIIKSIERRQRALSEFMQKSKFDVKKRITVYFVDSEAAEDKVRRELRSLGYEFIFEGKKPSKQRIVVVFNTIKGFKENIRLVREVVEKRDVVDIAMIIRKNKLGESIVEELKNMFIGIPIEVRDYFTLRKCDVVIMNPPFSDREKMPREYQNKLNNLVKKYEFVKESIGGQINLWGYFLGLAHFLLKDNGKLGAVIPINIARGKATEKIRKFFLENYHIRWIIKPVADLAFSEAAAFRDIFFIAEKRKPKENDITGIIFIKKSIRSSEFTPEEAKRIVRDLRIIYEKAREGKIKYYSDPNGFFDVYFVDYKTLEKHRDNLMPLLKEAGLEGNIMEIIFEKAKNKLTRIDKKYIRQGFHTSPAGLSELVYITRPLDKSRVERNVVMILHSEDEAFIYVVLKDRIKNLLKEFRGKGLEEFIRKNTKPDFKIPKNCVVPGLRTITGIKTIDITNKHDYIIVADFPEFEKVLLRSKWKDKDLWRDPIRRAQFWKMIKKKLEGQLVYTATPEKFNIYSSNTFVICIAAKVKMIFNQTFRINVINNPEFSLIYALSFNSIFGLHQVIRRISEATGEFVHLSTKDLETIYILDANKLSQQEKQLLLNLFEEIKDIEFPCIIEQMRRGLEYVKQYKDKPWKNIFEELKQRDPGMYARIKLDYTILKVLGFNDDEIKELLEKLYETVYKELEAIKRAR